MENFKSQYVWGVLRLLLGWTFLWAFVDKLFGLGFNTVADKSWLDGVSPTFGFLKFGTKGPFASLYQSLAGNPVVDWLFMMGLLLIGLSLILGIGVKVASYSGILLMAMMYTAASIWPEHNPFLDDHIINAVILLGLALSDSGQYLGLGGWWGQTRLVQKYKFLR
ncbi:MAG: hypothetical protein A2725_03050 [Candidatus Magasanikbacteria bacterium RIFCSPHIGHO2_01_FULL_33_34]|uniref:DoxX family protein n=1 Tax=Candidatus Magasanikbacteria bacterium RIFCSPHIGHO2_01_FULL_33_34 TaxID=1798671 RepID=A0A1F6LH23_9BACT|nr:MAG: hypothetical protein A2725_03050 [Candidatus Magasanikbacteria bacterium RIFCSPHIGHO2_01_FULL_33_34]OGH66110.1 MAG: hypothetical protein A3B83_00540 [Candidatus Magasanikbacteria bacterium RIFCSPHIGHO2_02_FULL_33_17]OGH75956.1 MAG: hypothetical protein A3A89_00450 [Candidatus Magasanikbacteria bacterium RIFCSPLOWO2_01_FULL_33_34]